MNQIDAYWQQVLNLSQAGGYPFGILCGLDDLARLCCYKGELRRAADLFQRAFQILDTDGFRSPRWLGATQRDYSDLLREYNRLEEAQALMAESLALSEQWDLVSGQGLGCIHMGRILLADGDLPGAESILQKAEQICRNHTVYPDLLTIVALFRAQLLLETQQAEAAWKVLEACLHSPCCQHAFHREWVLIAQARVLLRKAQPNEALALLASRRELAQANGRGRNWLETTLLTALAQDAAGDPAQAQVTLREALAYAQPQGFRRIFLDEGEPQRALLWQYAQQTPKSDLVYYVADLLAAFPPVKARVGTISSGETQVEPFSLIEPLTGRELEVLRLVCEGFSNQEIAARLVLSVGTVKTHVHNIFGKLGVNNRPQAISKVKKMDTELGNS